MRTFVALSALLLMSVPVALAHGSDSSCAPGLAGSADRHVASAEERIEKSVQVAARLRDGPAADAAFDAQVDHILFLLHERRDWGRDALDHHEGC